MGTREERIQEILDRELDMFLSVRAREPVSCQQDPESVTTSFVKYLRGELETYSEETLALLYKDVNERHGRKENQAEQVYFHMVKSHGYGSIEEAEAATRESATWTV